MSLCFVVGMEGQLTVFPCSGSGTPCYQCIYPNPPQDEACKSCANAGVLGPVPGVIGTLQAVEVLKLLTHPEVLLSSSGLSADKQVQALVGRQLYYDATTGEFHTFAMRSRRPNCPACGGAGAGVGVFSAPVDSPATSAPLALSPLAALHARLGAEFRVSAADYSLGVLRAGVPHLLLDVRSSVQFDLISLAHLFPPLQRSGSEASSRRVLNLPYARLEGAGLSDLSALTAFCGAVEEATAGERGPLSVYVLCRRGNDSVRAVLRLLALREEVIRTAHQSAEQSPGGKSEDGTGRLRETLGMCRFLNIDGGLHSWAMHVDQDFPMY
jgi:adenylyltransferase and sulfurtransferase